MADYQFLVDSTLDLTVDDTGLTATVGLPASGVTAGVYSLLGASVDAQGRIVSASEASLSSDFSGDGSGGSPLALSVTGVTAGTYAIIGATVDSKGRISSAQLVTDPTFTTIGAASGAFAVDASGNVTTNNLSNPNLLINSAGLVNQRVVSGTVVLSAGEYGHDRLKGGASGCTYTFAESAGVVTFTISAGSLIQTIETTKAGAHTLSWTGTAQGSLDGGTAGASPITETLTGGANVNVEWGTGTLSRFKVEEGTKATPWTLPDFTTELARCHRYFQRIKPDGAYGGIGLGFGGTTTIGFVMRFLSTPMRVLPALTSSSVANMIVFGNGSNFALTSLGINSDNSTATGDGSVIGLGMTISVAAGLPVDHAIYVRWNNDAAGYIDLNSEL